MKVLHVITRLDRGGSSESTLLTAIGLAREGYEVTVATGPTSTMPAQYEGEAKEAGVRFVSIPHLVRALNPLRDILALGSLFRLLRARRFDIVHTHTSKAGILGRLAACLARVPVLVHTPHGHIFYGYFNLPLTRVFILLERLAARSTDRIITLSQRGKEEHVAFGIAPPEKFTVIHSGIGLAEGERKTIGIFQKKQELGIPEKAPVIGTAGRLVPIKGHRYLLSAFSQVRKALPQAILLLGGDGPLRKELEKQARQLRVSEGIRFLGWREDLGEIITLMDVFVLPSLNEGMGRVLVEAQLQGKPAVASRVGGIPDIVGEGETGLLVPPHDPDSLARAIMHLLSNPEVARRMGTHGKQKALANFSEKSAREKTKALYEELFEKYGHR